jgi:hypothetical protein
MNRPLIARPRRPRNHPDRFLECQRAVENTVVSAIGEASAAGWQKDEIVAAMIAVADDMQLALNAKVLLSVETELRKLMKNYR